MDWIQEAGAVVSTYHFQASKGRGSLVH